MSDSLKFFWLFWFTAILCFIVTESMAGMCEKVATDCIEGGDTRLIDCVSVYRDCWRYEYSYKCKGYALNNCAEYKDEAYCLAYQSECIVNVGNWCVAQKHNYKCEEEEKYIRQEKRFRYPTMKKDNFLERKKVVCNEKIRCVDGKCFDYTSDANNEMGEAASMLNALKEMQGDYAKHLSVFKGDVKNVLTKLFR